MLVKLRQKTQIHGHIYKRDEVVEITDDEYKLRPSCYEPTESAKEGKTITPTETARPMTRAQLQAKLDSLDIPYKARDTVEELQRRLDEVINNHPVADK